MRYLLVLFLLSGCLPGHQNEKQYTFSFSSRELDGGVLPVPRGETVSVEVVVRDADGNITLINPIDISWSAGDGSILEVNSFDGHAWIKGRQDWFDTVPGGADASAGHEPTTDLTVDYRGSSASIQVIVILNAQGRWEIQVDQDDPQEMNLSQDGRSVRYDRYGFTGAVNGNIFTFSGLGYDLTGPFTSSDRIEGTYENHNKGTTGPWTGQKL